MSELFKQADAEIKSSLEEKIKATYKTAILVKSKNDKEIERLTARNKAITDNLDDLAKRYEAGEFLEISDIDEFVSSQTETMNTGSNGRKLRI